MSSTFKTAAEAETALERLRRESEKARLSYATLTVNPTSNNNVYLSCDQKGCSHRNGAICWNGKEIPESFLTKNGLINCEVSKGLFKPELNQTNAVKKYSSPLRY